MIGLNQVLDLDNQDDLKIAALQLLTQELQSQELPVQAVLYQLLSENTRKLVANFSAMQLPICEPNMIRDSQGKQELRDIEPGVKIAQYI